MPVTPFHFGPGLLLKVLVDASLTAFVGVNILIDVESGYHLVTGAYPVHTFLHTLVGATLAAIAVAAPLAGVELWLRRYRPLLPDGAGLERVPRSLVAIGGGALAGAWSHVLLDAIMHPDVQPFAPFADANPLLEVIPLGWLHLACVACAVAAAWIFIRQWGKVTC